MVEEVKREIWGVWKGEDIEGGKIGEERYGEMGRGKTIVGGKISCWSKELIEGS